MGILNWILGKEGSPKGSGASPAGSPPSGDSEVLAKDTVSEPEPIATKPAADATPEVIRVGAFGARISSVAPKCLEYIDMAGQEQCIDLEECARNWVGWRENHRQDFVLFPGATEQSSNQWDARCIGERGALDNPPWAAFMNERKTCFEFETYEALHEDLLGPLMQAGWHTFDTD